MKTEKKQYEETTEPFSEELSRWLKSGKTKTFLSLDEVFGERTFAILFMFLMATSALPIPTAGLTDVFAVITILFALQMAVGRESLWLPKRWQNMKLNKTMREKLLPGLVKIVRKIERYSRPRLIWVFKGRISNLIIGLGVAVLAASTITAPPFSGLDTVPALGAILIASGIVLKDGLILIIGGIVGTCGVLMQVLLGKIIVDFVTKLF